MARKKKSFTPLIKSARELRERTAAMESIPANMSPKLLSAPNYKTKGDLKKAEKYKDANPAYYEYLMDVIAKKLPKYASSILYLEPAGKHCPGSSPECRSFCLAYSGRLAHTCAHTYKVDLNTTLLEEARPEFFRFLRTDLRIVQSVAEKKGMKAIVRLGGLGELPCDIFRDGENLFREFSGIEFYDYTKIHKRTVLYRELEGMSNFHLFWSRDKLIGVDNVRWSREVYLNESRTWDVIANSKVRYISTIAYNLKKDQPVPDSIDGVKCIDGDIIDFQHWYDDYLDSQDIDQVFVILRPKGNFKVVPQEV